MDAPRDQKLHTVFLVGAGPGDPGLITVKGEDALMHADVVIADRLVSPKLLEGLVEGAELIVRGEHRRDLPQEEINRLLVEKARAGKRVVRLKGGDPFVFGRGGEEAEALHAAGIPFEIVPGVTAAIAAPAYAGIPVTHRGVAGAVTFVTGHETDDKSAGHIDWDGLARGAGTIVLYMSVTHLPRVVDRLLAAGRAPSTPVAIIERGTTMLQRTITGTLGDIVDVARAANVKPPALTIVGEVVQLRRELAWFDAKPLRGARILLFGSGSEQNSADPHGPDSDEVDERLAALGVERLYADPLETRPLVDNLREPLAHLDRYRWLVLTSNRAVEVVREALAAARLDGRALAGLRIASIEGKTSSWIDLRLRLCTDVTAPGGATALADAILASAPPHGPVLFPRVKGGREELPTKLRAAGIEVDVIDAYETEVDRDGVREVVEEHERAPFSAIAFGSPRGVDAFLDGGGLLSGCLVGAIGKTTAAALEARGVTVDVVASRPSYPVLIDELASALARGADMK